MPEQAKAAKSLLGAVASNVMGRIVTLAAPFLIMPAMLAYLGPGGFGVWVTGISVVGLAGFMDFGLGTSLLTRLSVHFGRTEIAAARRDIGAAYRMLGQITLAGLALLILCSVAIMLWPRAGIAFSQGDGALILLTLLFFLIGLPLSVVQRILFAHQQIAIYNLLLIATALVSIATTLFAIHLALPGWAVVSIYSAAAPVLMMATTLWYFARFPQYRPQRKDFAFDHEAGGMLRLGLSHLRLGILTSVGMNIDIPIILYTLGPNAVADFALPVRIGSLLTMAIATAFMPLWSYNGAAIARHDYAWVRRSALLFSVIGGVGIAVIGLCMTLTIDQIMQIWTGRAFPDQMLVLATMSVAATIIAITSPWNMVLNAAAVVNPQFWAWLGFVVISVLGKVLLVPAHGAWVVAAVTAAAYAITVTPVIIWHALRLTRQPAG